MTAPARAHVRETTHRLIASRLPPVGVFDDLSADKDELAMAFLLESATNDRLGILSRRLPLLPENEIVQGPGATMVMAAFLHADEASGRFTDGRLGAWYASFDVETMIAETVYHSTRRLRLSEGAFPSSIQMRELVAGIDCELIDIRGQRRAAPICTTRTITARRRNSVSVCVGRLRATARMASCIIVCVAPAVRMSVSIAHP